MKLLNKYLIKNYSETFFPIFLTLYTITSMVFLVKIASLTSVIQINFLELLELYSYSLPTILFYTLPISIFVSLSLTLSKLSSEYELIVITSFGLNPIKILKLIFPTLLLSTILLLLISLALIPKAEYMRDTFLENKKTEAQFNIKASEYGQAFGKWLIYVDKEKNGKYNDIVLFQYDLLKNEDTFILAHQADIKNDGKTLNLNLENGKALNISEKINQVDFEKMTISNQLKQSNNINTLDDLLQYWADIKINKIKEAEFAFGILSSLFPLVSILFAIFIGYFNPRYDKNRATPFALIMTTIYLVASHRLTKEYGITAIMFIPVLWFIISIMAYQIRIKPHY